ncbi:MAG: DNA polymerase III subunit delta' [Streptococcaceae bacterium]|jgi:DNA polymerase-3 subunit delta'|nr:DNA polymerase III subunit delta' [Streptococcaceae bacterium]
MNLPEVQPVLYKRFLKILDHQALFHAYLFDGLFGSFDFAIWLSQSQFCLEPQGCAPCGQCRNCQLIATQSFADVRVIEPIGQAIKVEQIREMLSEMNQTGIEGQKRVFIIKSVETLSQGAANALLKFIEEPKMDTYLFFITNQIKQVLPTIRSRTQVFHFEKNEDYLCEKLKQQDILPTRAELLARITDDLTLASHLNESSWFKLGAPLVKQWVDDLSNGKPEVFADVAAQLVAVFDDKDKQKIALKIVAFYLENKMMVTKNGLSLGSFFKIEEMFASNVSFQNCLEYLVLQSLWR